MKAIVVLLLILSPLLLMSCATPPPPLSPSIRSGIREVSISDEMPVKSNMIYDRIRVSTALMGSLSSTVVNTVANNTESEAIRDAMKKNNISLKQILKEKLVKLVSDLNMFTVIDNTGDAIFKVTIDSYGFYSEVSLVPIKLKPCVQLTLELTGADGNTLWKGYSYTLQTSQTKGFSYDEMIKSPELIGESFESAFDIILAECLRRMLKS